MIPSRLRSLKAHAPDLLSLGVFVGLPGWLVPAWKGASAVHKFTAGECDPTIEDLQVQVKDLTARVQELEKKIP